MNNIIRNMRNLYGKLFGTMLVLRLTSNCNMQCAYCYVAKDGCLNAGENKISVTFVQKILKYLELENPSGIQVILTGGEPLLYKPLIMEIVEYTEKLSIPSWIGIITNATLLDNDFVRYLASKRISLSISLDSPDFRYNKLRIAANRMLHETILENIETALKSGIVVGINAVVNSLNADHIDYLIDYCLEKGIRDFSLLPLSYTGRAKENMYNSVDCNQMYETMRAATERIIAANETAGESKIIERNISVLVKEMMGIPMGPGCFSNPCGAGLTMLAMNVNGDIYPCDQYIGNNKMILCNIEKDNIEHKIVEHSDLNDIILTTKKRSGNCFTCEHTICNGGCKADHIESHGIGWEKNVDYWCNYYKMFYSYLKNLVDKTPEKAKWLTLI